MSTPTRSNEPVLAICPAWSDWCYDAIRRSAHASVSRLVDLGLTRRQTEVAAVLVETCGSNSQLARQLDISESTVKKHLETIFRALGVDSRPSAIVALSEPADTPG